MLIILIFIGVLALDQLSKALCASWLPTLPGKTYSLIKGVFSLTYVENRGAAFGMLQNKQAFFIVITVLVCAFIAYLLVKERKKMHPLMKAALSLVLAGAAGNFIDRVFLGYVRDMFYFELIDFAVFNVADAAITVGAAILILDVLFFKGRDYLADGPKDKKPEAQPEEKGPDTGEK